MAAAAGGGGGSGGSSWASVPRGRFPGRPGGCRGRGAGAGSRARVSLLAPRLLLWAAAGEGERAAAVAATVAGDTTLGSLLGLSRGWRRLQRLLGSVGGGSGSSSSEDEPEEFLGFHLEDEVTQSSRRAALRSKRGTALPVRKKERKKRAATEDTPPKRLVKQKAVESQRERMVKALAELLQKSKRSPARIGRPPISGPKVGRKLPKQTKQGPEPDDSIKSTISPTLSSQIEKTINSIVSPRPRGRPPGSSRKRLVTEAESPCESTKAPSSIPEPSISPQSSSPCQVDSPSSQPPEDLKKPPLILKFFSKARRHKSDTWP
ncbi:histone-lysine N-methyltransferase 2B-like [Anolis carolinensis]|uniref:histone-lysine N-methyltransferase 2B-like n=1 Tax=Anolis carolinensis TaxID=28377 RepID=UPI002F2B3B15